MFQHVRTGTYDAHVASQHVKKLGEFVDVGFAHEIAKGKFAGIVTCCLQVVCVFVDMHRTEFVTIKVFAVQSGALLFEEEWSGTLALDDDGNDRYEWKQNQKYDDTYHYVEQTFDETIGSFCLAVTLGRVTHYLRDLRLA